MSSNETSARASFIQMQGRHADAFGDSMPPETIFACYPCAVTGSALAGVAGVFDAKSIVSTA